jgi:hypothetical protein
MRRILLCGMISIAGMSALFRAFSVVPLFQSANVFRAAALNIIEDEAFKERELERPNSRLTSGMTTDSSSRATAFPV